MKWLEVGFRLVPYITAAVGAVERFLGKKGQEKQDAAVDMVDTMLKTAEAGADKDLLNDEAVQQASRRFIDAYVALQNVLATRAGK